MELIRKSDALHAVLHNQGDAAVAAVQMIPSPWISVKDRLPEESGYYLVCYKTGWITDMHFSAKHQLWNVHDHSRNLENKIAVTHWMPLPEQPEVEG
jgi:hypothetical protein